MIVVTGLTPLTLNKNLKKHEGTHLPLGNMYKLVDKNTQMYCINVIKKEDYRYVVNTSEVAGNSIYAETLVGKKDV